MSSARIRAGIGGWNYKPWRETFYPPEIKAAQELEYASRQVTAIEINSTFYRLQKADVFAKWRDATPDGFIFSIKAPRFIVQRRQLAEGVSGVERFLSSGIAELREKLGPILWQLNPAHSFDAEDLNAFFELLPPTFGKLTLRHAINVRHDSFKSKDFIDLARKHDIAVVFEDDETHPAIADLTSDFVYARLRRAVSSEPSGYPIAEIKRWASRARQWLRGELPDDLHYVESAQSNKRPRDVYVFFINGAKERAPAAARALIAELA